MKSYLLFALALVVAMVMTGLLLFVMRFVLPSIELAPLSFAILFALVWFVLLRPYFKPK